MSSEPANAGGKGSHVQSILIVDDDLQVRHALCQVLQRAGLPCIEADSGVQALGILAKENDVALVMSDVRMAQMDGIELLARIRTRWPDVVVMMVTDVDNAKIAVHSIAMGAVDYLVKPMPLEEIRARVVSALDRRRVMLEHRAAQDHLIEMAQVPVRRVERFVASSLPALVSAWEAKDPFMQGHAGRVSRYASIIAAEFRLSADDLRQVELGGLLHDIGKLSISDVVLQRPGKITGDEYAQIMSYALTGYRFLEPLLEDAPVALRIVRSHHERFDGAGIPDAASGAAIPLEARIVAVADALDAMTSRRPYRPNGLTFDEATREIVRCSGTQFDPDVVIAFLNAVKSGHLGVETPIAAVTKATGE